MREVRDRKKLAEYLEKHDPTLLEWFKATAKYFGVSEKIWIKKL